MIYYPVHDIVLEYIINLSLGEVPAATFWGLRSMVREIIHDEMFLAQKAELASPQDLPIAQDLMDTITAHKDRCVGMAANMIGENKVSSFLITRAPI